MIGRLSSVTYLRPAAVAAFLVFAAFVFYHLLIRSFPVVYWGDAHIRLALRDQILLGRWLPLLQILIFIISKFSRDLLVLRGCLAMLAAGTLAGAYYFVNRIFAPTTGLIAIALLGISPIFVALSIVPYTEILFAGLLFLALALLVDPPSSRHFAAGVIALNLASLTRYEGWLLAGLLISEEAILCLRSKEWTRLIRHVFLYGMAPLSWLSFVIFSAVGAEGELKELMEYMVILTGNSSGHTLPAILNPDYIRSFAASYFHLLKWQTGPVIIALGILGWLMALLEPGRRLAHWRNLAFVILVWVLWLAWFSIHVWEPLNFALRTAFIAEIFLILYAAYGLERFIHLLAGQLSASMKKASLVIWGRLATSCAVIAILVVTAPSAINFVADTSQASDFSVPARAGEWLGARLTQDDVVVALTDDTFQAYALAAYIQLPFDSVLDNRFDRQFIHSRLTSSHLIYVVELYKSRAGLSVEESSLLRELESGRTPAQEFTIGSSRVWVVARDSLLSSR
jgi:hypothetical protein